jgi:SpoVK/Ycf46/Vps4 family AAA+-type ATPase
VATLLALMDGLDDRGNVVVIGATNRINSIDAALRRPGRFDREFSFNLPNKETRRDILKIHTSSWTPPLGEDLLNRLAQEAVDFSGADLKALCVEASLRAIRRSCPRAYDLHLPPPDTSELTKSIESLQITDDDFQMAFRGIAK